LTGREDDSLECGGEEVVGGRVADTIQGDEERMELDDVDQSFGNAVLLLNRGFSPIYNGEEISSFVKGE
jgi:hypothetical protein